MADVGNLTARLSLDTQDFSQGITSIESMAGKLGSGIQGALGGVASAVGASVTAAAGLVTKLVSESVKSFGEYEQMVSGAQKIFDGMDYGKIAADASNAWMTMNLSASEYLEMINKVGASFVATMGDSRGYEVAQKGMQAISDFATGTGRSVEELNTKFMLISRATQSYQSIADQFSGILPATSQQFLAQAQAAGALSKEYNKLTEVPIAEYQQTLVKMLETGVDALNLTGNTAAESTSTLKGSIEALKASWKNLVQGLSDSNSDLKSLFENLAVQAETAFNNLLPPISAALQGIGHVITDLVPIIAAEIPKLVTTLTPLLLEAAVKLVDSVVTMLPSLTTQISDSLINVLPSVVNVLFKTLLTLMNTAIPDIVEIAVAIIITLGKGLTDNMDLIVEGVLSIIDQIVKTVTDNMSQIIEIGLQLVLELATSLVKNEDLLIDAIVKLVTGTITAILENIPLFVEVGVKIVVAIATGIVMAIPKLLEAIGQMLGIIDDTTRDVEGATKSMVSMVDTSSSDIKSSLKSTTTEYKEFTTELKSLGSTAISVTNSQSAAIESTARSTETNFAQAYESMVRTAEGFRKSTTDTTEWVKETTTYIYDANGNVVGSFEATSMTIKSQAAEITTKTEEMASNAMKSESKISSAMSSVTASAASAANSVKNSVDQMNSALGSISGGNVSISKRASGGPVEAGVPYMTGEEGRELFIPRTDGYILNNDDTESFMESQGGGQINIVIQGDVYDDERSMRNKLKAAVINVLEEQVAYG